MKSPDSQENNFDSYQCLQSLNTCAWVERWVRVSGGDQTWGVQCKLGRGNWTLVLHDTSLPVWCHKTAQAHSPVHMLYNVSRQEFTRAAWYLGLSQIWEAVDCIREGVFHVIFSMHTEVADIHKYMTLIQNAKVAKCMNRCQQINKRGKRKKVIDL
jgi:hypothetical protein